MSLFPLLRRTATSTPAFFRAPTLFRICPDILRGETSSSPSGSITETSSVGVPINSPFFVTNSERRKTSFPPFGIVRLSLFRRHTLFSSRSSSNSPYSISLPMQKSFASPLPLAFSTKVRLVSTAPLIAAVPEMRLKTSSANSFLRWWISSMAIP